jgi:hypothetical protein
VRILLACHGELSEGRLPPPLFWKALAQGLRLGQPRHWIGRPPDPPDLPIKIRLQFRAQNHRPIDPGLEMRNQVVKWFVGEAMKKGLAREDAFEETARACHLSTRTVKRAVYRD